MDESGYNGSLKSLIEKQIEAQIDDNVEEEAGSDNVEEEKRRGSW